MIDKSRYIKEVEIEEKDKVIIIALPKYFYIGNIVEVEQTWDQVLKKEPTVICFNCQNLEFIDSSAIGTLVKFFNTSVKNSIEMYVFGLSSELIKIFETTKINRIMSVIEKDEFYKKFIR